jgi:hypothetical protein
LYFCIQCIKINVALLTLAIYIYIDVEEWEEKIENKEVDVTIAAISFLKFLKSLRVIIIQDFACLMDKYPSHLLFQHPIFTSNSFLVYKQNLLKAIEETEDPVELALRNAVSSTLYFNCLRFIFCLLGTLNSF